MELDEKSTQSIIVTSETAGSRDSRERQLVRKLDMRLMPTVMALYLFNYMDRTNVATARLQGLQEDLKISDIQYSFILSAFYIAYIPFQIPSNMLINRISRPSYYIAICMISWGLASLLTGVTKNFTQVLACRLILGVPEAAFYPGIGYLLSRWYTKKELAFRSTIFYTGSLLAGIVSSLLAAGILGWMEGVLGIHAWRWLFFVEGAPTILFGFIAMWLLPNFPHNTSWMTREERFLAQARIAEDAGEADCDVKEDSSLRGLIMALKDVKVWILALMSLVLNLGTSFGLFLPTITKTLGFSNTITLILLVPQPIVSIIFCLMNSWHADKTRERFFHFSSGVSCAILAYIICLSTMSIWWRYASFILLSCGSAGQPIILVWISNVSPRPPAKRAAAIAVMNSVSNIGTAIGAFVWPRIWGPTYHRSQAICLSLLIVDILLALLLRQILVHENKNMERDERDMPHATRERVEEAARLEGITIEEATQKRKGFRYLY